MAGDPIMIRKFQFTDLEHNNNKWWMIKRWADGTTQTFWGRVGLSNEGEAEYKDLSEVDKIIHDKMKKGYVEVELANLHDVQLQTSPKQLPFDSVSSKYINDLLAEAGESIRSFLSVTLDSMSLSQIKKGRQLLKDISFAYERKKANRFPNTLGKWRWETQDFIELITEYYKAIPTQLPHKIDKDQVVNEFMSDLHEQEDRLDQLEAAVIQVAQSQLPQDNTVYNPLNETKLEFIPSKDPAYIAVQDYVRKSSSKRVIDILRVEIPAERKSFMEDTIGKNNIAKLWHGSPNKNSVHILRKGLIIPQNAANGSRFGRGIYFADKAQKSINYTGYNSKFFSTLYLCDVALGNPWKSGGQDAYMTSAKPGFDSTWGNMSYGGMDEFIVYRTQQQTIKAIVFVEK